LAGALALIWLIRYVGNYIFRYRCPSCKSRTVRITEIIERDVALGAGYFADKYRETCPACGDYHEYTANMWLYGN